MKNRFTFFATFAGLLLSTTLANASYNDVTEDSPYKEGVDYLELVGAAKDADLFYPDRDITKAEFYKILFEVFQDKLPNGQTGFKDVPENAWFAPYAHLAQNNDLESGSLFGPSKKVSKIDAMKTLLEAYGVAGGVVPWSERTQLFADISTIHPYYSTVARLIDEGILTADPESNLNPYEQLTRGDAANLMLDFEEWDLRQKELESSQFYKSDIFASIWNQIMNDFYLSENQEIDPDALFNAAIKGMLSSLGDPYTTYFTPEQSNDFSSALNGSFEGIGAYVNQDASTGQFMFTEFVPNSPAASSGLKSGDIILSIDGISTQGLSLEEVMNRIKGPADTSVTLSIQRNELTLQFTLTRAAIELQLVTGKIIHKDSWYFNIDSFGDSTVSEFIDTLRTLKTEVPTPTAIVLDLRNNGGGYLMSSTQIAGFFAPHLTPLVTLDYGEHSEDIVNGDDGDYKGIPMFILVNGYTASASEILTQDLKEVNKATVIGTQTFGKGSAQTITQFWDGSELKITIAHWLSSNGTSINGVGVTPDITIAEDASSSEDLWMKAVLKAIEKL